VFPVAGVRYGIPDAPRLPFPIETASGTVWEFPLAVAQVGRRAIPVGGGTYFRILPGRLLRLAIGRYERERRSAVLYFHPYEFHEGWLYLSGVARRQRLHAAHLRFGVLHNLATRAVARRLRSLLLQFSFGPLGELYRMHAADRAGAASPAAPLSR
jgi:hypothetical protein